MRQGFVIVVCLAVCLGIAPAALAQEPPPAVLAALADLNARLGTTLTLDDLDFWTWEQRSFPDTGLGCPQPGKTYAPIATSAYVVRFTLGGERYEYRVSAHDVILCTPGSEPTATPAAVTPTLTPTAAAPTPQPTPTRAPDAPITAENAAQVELLAAIAWEQPIQQIAFLPAPFQDAVAVFAETGALVYVGAADPMTPFPIGHVDRPTLRVALAPGEGDTVSMVTAEADPANPGAITIWVWALVPGDPPELSERFGFQLPIPAPNGLIFSPDGQRMAISGGSLQGFDPDVPNAVWVWDVASGVQIATLPHVAAVSDVAFSPDGATLAAASIDDSVRLWSVEDQAQIGVLATPTSFRVGQSLAFSPDGILLAVGGEDGTVQVWDVPGEVELTTLRAYDDGPVRYVAFSPDGSLLVTGGSTLRDSALNVGLQLWDSVAGERLAALAEHDEPVTGLAFAQDGLRLLSAGEQTWWVWGVP